MQASHPAAEPGPICELQAHLLAQFAAQPAAPGSESAGKWDAEDLAVVAIFGEKAGVEAAAAALTQAAVDGYAIVHHSSLLQDTAIAQPREHTGDAVTAAHALGHELLTVAAQSDLGGTIDLAPLTGCFPDLDDRGALLEQFADAICLLTVHPNALRAVAAAAEAEAVTWQRIGTTGGELLVITGDGISAAPTHTLLAFDVAVLREQARGADKRGADKHDLNQHCKADSERARG